MSASNTKETKRKLVAGETVYESETLTPFGFDALSTLGIYPVSAQKRGC
jgi:hypothetical protein